MRNEADARDFRTVDDKELRPRPIENEKRNLISLKVRFADVRAVFRGGSYPNQKIKRDLRENGTIIRGIGRLGLFKAIAPAMIRSTLLRAIHETDKSKKGRFEPWPTLS